MKKYISLLLCSLMCLSLFAACGKKGSSEDEATSTPSVSETGLRLTQTESVTSDSYMNSSDFMDFISMAEPLFVIPGLNEAMIPQGMSYCSATNLIYISGYYISDAPSVIVAVDATSYEFVAEYFLYCPDGSPFSSHVGGLAATETSLFVSATLDNDGSYSIAKIPLSGLKTQGSYDIVVTETIPVPVSPSFLSYSGGYLWLGNFYYPKADYDLSTGMNYTTETSDDDYGCYILAYDESDNFSAPEYILSAPDRIQGFALMNDGTAVLSQSYGRKNDSTLYRYDLDLSSTPDTQLVLENQSYPAYILDSKRLLSSTTAMPMTEALTVSSGDTLLVLFESGAMHYSDGKFRTDNVWELIF
jgi:hypothetical protein